MAQRNKELLIIPMVGKDTFGKDLRKERQVVVHLRITQTDKLLLASQQGLGKSKLNTGYPLDVGAAQF